VYALPSSFHAQVIGKGFECTPLEGVPFAANGEKFLDEAVAQHRMKYLDSLMDRFYDTLYTIRTQAIGEVLRVVQPDIILLDSFSPTDFIILYPFLKAGNIKLAFLQTMLSFHRQPNSLPLDCPVVPGDATNYGWHWNKYFFLRWLRNAKDTIFWLGRPNMKLIERKFRQQQINPLYRIDKKQIFKVGFENIPEFVTSPQELEFTMAKESHQHYLGPLIDLDRKQTEQAGVDYRAALRPDCPVIYCSLGTLYEHAKKEKPIYRHFAALIEVARTLPDYEFVISLKQEFAQKFKDVPANVYFFDRVSQLDVLSKASLFISHGGLQSVKESMANRVPMLIYPVWRDQFGNAARIAYYGLGLTGKLGKDRPKVMRQKMEKLLADGDFKINLVDFDAAISKKYTPGQIIETFESVMAEAVIV
jgi:UDP:flavonoid glycosyltransferase YjiC (YdhE family)